MTTRSPQDFCDWADPLRQEAVNKNKFKTILWEQLCEFIKTDKELQTDEEPASARKSSKSKASAGDIAQDEISSFIRQLHPEWDERNIFLEKLVETKIAPMSIHEG